MWKTRNLWTVFLYELRAQPRAGEYVPLPEVPSQDHIGSSDEYNDTEGARVSDFWAQQIQFGFEKTSYLTQFMLVEVIGRIIGKQATMSRKQTHTQLVTLTKDPHLPRSKCRLGRTLERPLHKAIPCGMTYEVIIKTILALTIEAKAVVDRRKITP